MLSPEGDQMSVAHGYVFGYRPECTSAATHTAPALRIPQPPPTAPPMRARSWRCEGPDTRCSLMSRRPAERRHIFAGTLSQRQVRRRRIVFSSSVGGGEHSVAAVPQTYYGAANLDPGPQVALETQEYRAPIPSGNSTSLCSKTVAAVAKTKLNESARSPRSPVVVFAPRTNPYYHRFQAATPSVREQANADAAPMWPRGISRNAAESSSPNARAPLQPQIGNPPSLRTAPSAGSVTTCMVTGTATQQKSDGLSVFERLAGESSVGVTVLGKRVRQWAEDAGLTLHPPNSVWHALLAYSTEPLKYERLWRRACAKGRHRLSLLAHSKVGNITASASQSREHNVEKRPSHADPHQKGMSQRDQSSARRRSFPAVTPGGLSAYRRRQEHIRWCQWQLWHFFQQGSSYLTSVWRVSSLLGRRRPHTVRYCGSAESAATSSALRVSLIFNGRYAVPSATSIDAAQEEHKAMNRRVNILARLLLEESGSGAVTSAVASRSRDVTRSSESVAARGEGDVGCCNASEPEGEVEADAEEANVYHLASESRRRSESVAATQPFLEVRIDEATGLMHLSLYVNGDAGGNGAEFVGSSVAGCIDNHRWVILKGLWARQVVMFCFHRGKAPLSSTDKLLDGHLKKRDGYDEQTEQDVSRRSRIVDGLVVNGVAFAKMQAGFTSTTAHDTFVCTRCGHTRRRQNEVYASKQTGRIARGVYYCVVCLTRTHHVRLPPMGDMPPVLLGERAAAVADASGVRALRGFSSGRSDAPSARSANTSGLSLLPSAYACQRSGSEAISADAPQVSLEAAVTAVREWTLAAAAAPRPAWHPGLRVNSDDLFGRTRGLDSPPPRPRVM
ncbi:hypothetical protein GH5_02746 [Leishmania sp. Ghana 2012 LV757]|uniref:hypothetical protein n=1 Tax=Leishmania sp. Ghana 2012 LV757 TaxID=2803181 RepID=UPI001B5869E4|nr:hypothetical protein GH5_02746 [Leishmania sp. Ghana 2012 LV757]